MLFRSPIENISSEPSRKVVTNLGLTYDMDQVKVAEAMKIVREIAADHKEALEEKLSVGFTAFGDFALNISFIYYIRKEASNLDTKTAINMDILERFNAAGLEFAFPSQTDRKSTRLNSSHKPISYAVFCLKKKN